MNLCVATYNIKNGKGMNGKVSLKAIADTLDDTGAAVIALQEVDYFRPRSFFKAQANKLGLMLGMGHVFGPTIKCRCLPLFGNAVLAKFKIMESKNYPLPSTGENRFLLKAKIKIENKEICFFCTHLGLKHPERMNQVNRIVQIIHNEKGPIILAGDFNAGPESDEINKIKTLLSPVDPQGTNLTFPSNEPKHKIDYIFYSVHWSLVRYFVYNSQASDHLPLIANLQLL